LPDLHPDVSEVQPNMSNPFPYLHIQPHIYTGLGFYTYGTSDLNKALNIVFEKKIDFVVIDTADFNPVNICRIRELNPEVYIIANGIIHYKNEHIQNTVDCKPDIICKSVNLFDAFNHYFMTNFNF
jgi:GTPase SAR1 family protein